MWAGCLSLQAARKEFWESKDPANWSNTEKEILLGDSPWARAGFARMGEKSRPPSLGYGKNGKQGLDMPDPRPGVPPGGAKSVPIGEPVPPVPKPDSRPLRFRLLARWETAKPVRLAGGPEVPDLTGEFYVVRLRGLPLMPPTKVNPSEPAPPNPNEGMLQAIKEGTRLERTGKAAIVCAHLFTGSRDAATDVLLFFSRGTDPITIADRVVTLESQFGPFHVSIKFPLKEMVYKGELAL